MSNDFEFAPVAPKNKAKVAKVVPTEEVVEITAPEKEKPEAKVPSAADYDQDELAQIFDTIIFEGEYTEEVTIKNKLHVRFRTRNAGQIQNMIQSIDSMGAKMISTLSEVRTLTNLKDALIAYQSTELSGMKPEEKDKFFASLPGVIIGLLLDELQKFDLKVNFACEVGEENF